MVRPEHRAAEQVASVLLLLRCTSGAVEDRTMAWVNLTGGWLNMGVVAAIIHDGDNSYAAVSDHGSVIMELHDADIEMLIAHKDFPMKPPR
jgi:hypothetical protein